MAERRLLKLLLACALAVPVSYVPAPAACAQSNSVVVIVRFSESQQRKYCVELNEARITGLEALTRTRLAVETKDYGGSLGFVVCRIGGIGNHPGDCPGNPGHWHYWHSKGRSWEESSLGASSFQVEPGTLEGWTWQPDGVNVRPDADPKVTDCRMQQAARPPQASSASPSPPPPTKTAEADRDGTDMFWVAGIGAALAATIGALIWRRFRSG